ncbi:conserved hypothetical protein [Histoplasma capsulatum var. duboisii H88]|uniref:SMC (Structural maintenance of chromosomes) domain-containing protein n=1 Tax=Ajellomyces capsulatus (strain H88) TaxID=544711 RepID=F0U9F1_AJEC8|nr:conserved hypothetical protein [Histoplasma capsulatum var. duboisii H88]QSS51696.1 SMC (structural maintenance of chromosomes) domain-containing protein [Histoplasma capsulatum var. duboisii H88]
MENNQISLQENVANAFRERGIPVKRDDINAALADADTCKWIENHLTPETLLSKEELTVYTKIEATGSLKGILHGQEISSTKPFLDDEIRKAIGSLKASTAAVEHQTETLKLQCKELKSQIRNGNHSRQREAKAWAQWKNKHALEKQQIDVAVEDLTHDFETTLSPMKSLLITEAHTLLPQLAGKLKDDSQSLQSLEKIASIIQIDTADKELSARATELTAKLSRYLVEEVHSRLDRVYIEYLQSNAPGIDEGDEEALATLQEEINSLYSEIEILSEMTTQQEFKVPILRALQSSGAEARSTSQQQLERVFDTILDLTQSTERITEKLNNRQSHQTALNYLSTKYNCEQQSKQSEGQTGKAITPQKRLSRLSYMPSTPKDTDRKSSLSLPLDHGSKALEQLLRRLGVSTIDLVESGLTHDASVALDEKKQHMLEMLQNLQSTAESPLSLYLGTADQAAQLLHSALYADSSFEIAMVDGTRDGKLGALERQIEVLRKGIDGLDVGILHGGDKAQEKFMERWG